jgi:hypothetical protein
MEELPGFRRGQSFHEATPALPRGRRVPFAAEISRRAPGRRGKSGGVRVIYYWMQAAERIHLLLIYGKGEQADLSAADLQRVRTLVEQIKDD